MAEHSERYFYLKVKSAGVYELYQLNRGALVGLLVSLSIILATVIADLWFYPTAIAFFVCSICIGARTAPLTIFDTNSLEITLAKTSIALRLAGRHVTYLTVPWSEAVLELGVDQTMKVNGECVGVVLLQGNQIFGGYAPLAESYRPVYEEVRRLLERHHSGDTVEVSVLPTSVPGDQILIEFNGRRYIYVLPLTARSGVPMQVSTRDMTEVMDDGVELLQVKVPPNKSAGDNILCTDNSGQQFTAPVPDGLKAGNTFIVQIATATAIPLAETVNSPTHAIETALSPSPTLRHNRVFPAPEDFRVAMPVSEAPTDESNNIHAQGETPAIEPNRNPSTVEQQVSRIPDRRNSMGEERKEDLDSQLATGTETQIDGGRSESPGGSNDAVPPTGESAELESMLQSAVDKAATVEAYCKDKTSIPLSLADYESILKSLDFDFQKTQVMKILLPKIATVECAHLEAAIAIIIKDDLSFKKLQVIEAHAPFIQDQQNVVRTLEGLALDPYDMKVARRNFKLDENV